MNLNLWHVRNAVRQRKPDLVKMGHGHIGFTGSVFISRGIANAAHTGQSGGPDAIGRVFYNHAVTRRNLQLLCRQEKDFRIGLCSVHLVSGDDLAEKALCSQVGKNGKNQLLYR